MKIILLSIVVLLNSPTIYSCSSSKECVDRGLEGSSCGRPPTAQYYECSSPTNRCNSDKDCIGKKSYPQKCVNISGYLVCAKRDDDNNNNKNTNAVTSSCTPNEMGTDIDMWTTYTCETSSDCTSRYLEGSSCRRHVSEQYYQCIPPTNKCSSYRDCVGRKKYNQKCVKVNNYYVCVKSDVKIDFNNQNNISGKLCTGEWLSYPCTSTEECDEKGLKGSTCLMNASKQFKECTHPTNACNSDQDCTGRKYQNKCVKVNNYFACVRYECNRDADCQGNKSCVSMYDGNGRGCVKKSRWFDY